MSVGHLFHILWGTDFDMLQAKIRSFLGFMAFVVAGFSGVSNVLPRYERIANARLKATLAGTHKVVNFFALNWRNHKQEKPQ
jgi:hypothetical protein